LWREACLCDIFLATTLLHLRCLNRKRALDILSVLAEAGGAIVTKDELLDAVWPGVTVEENALQVHIVALRKALGSEADRLRTIRGVGYQLEVDGGEVADSTGREVGETETGGEHDLSQLANSRPLRAPSGSPSGSGPAAGRAAELRRWRLPVMIAGMLGVFAIAWAVLGSGIWPGQSDRIPVVIRTLTASTSGDRTETALASGVTDELIFRLRRLPGLRIATAGPDGEVDSEAFRNAYIVDGNIRTSGDRMKVTARLFSHTGEILWSQTFDRGLADLFDVQEEIAASIANALCVSFEVGANSADYGGTDNPEAYAAYVQYWAHQLDVDQTVPVRYLQRAIALDPKYVKALTSLSTSYGIRATGSPTRRQAVELLAKMDQSTAQAIKANPNLWMGHVSRGWYYVNSKDFPAADRSMRRAEALDKGNDPDLRGLVAAYSLQVGRTKKAASLHQSNIIIDPALRNASGLAWALLWEGRYQNAIDHFERAAAYDPSSIGNDVPNAFWAYLLLGNEAGAIQLAERYNVEFAAALREFKADNALPAMTSSELGAWVTQRYGDGNQVPITNTALLAAHYGHTRLALDLMRIASQRPGGFATGMYWHPAMAEARKTDAFEKLVIGSGLVRMWRESGDWGDYCRPVTATEITCT
jgi:TolB-like protein/DNA-binding winged helix-turn-helix (wHTH) protein